MANNSCKTLWLLRIVFRVFLQNGKASFYEELIALTALLAQRQTAALRAVKTWSAANKAEFPSQQRVLWQAKCSR